MNLKAVKTVQTGDWFKQWNLIDDNTGHVYGAMIFNSRSGYPDGAYHIYIHNVVDPDLGSYKNYKHDNRDVALAWARNEIENQKEPTMEELHELLARIRISRYNDEMSDDFAYSNGKIDRWNRLEAKVRNRMINGVVA